MKTKIFLILFSFLALACEQKTEHAELCVNVKLIKELCGQAILEILDPMYFNRGQSWKDGNGVELSHVFSTLLPCSFSDNFGNGSGVLESGQEFYIQFADTQQDDECARCKALLVGPEKFSYIKVSDCVQD